MAYPFRPAPSFQQRVRERARRFDLRSLVRLLGEHWYLPSEIVFRSSLTSTSRSMVEDVTFVDEQTGSRYVLITVNMGLLGDNSLLPSYFFAATEYSSRELHHAFHEFLGFFDHRLIERRLQAVYPEDDHALFENWSHSRASLLSAQGLSSPGTLQWLFQLYFPELRVHVERSASLKEIASNSVVLSPTDSTFDGTGVLGGRYLSDALRLIVELTAEEASTDGGVGWATEAKARIDQFIEPKLRGMGIPLLVRLQVLQHASWARLDPGSYLGYDRLMSPSEVNYSFIVYQTD